MLISLVVSRVLELSAFWQSGHAGYSGPLLGLVMSRGRGASRLLLRLFWVCVTMRRCAISSCADQEAVCVEERR